ncbi:MAG: TPM domain-containing protein [Bacteroidia bacterium]
MAWRPFSKDEELQITNAVSEAENGTSGEIRVHIDRYCKSDPLLKAQNLFHHLKMDETELRNGVIIYVSIDDHQVAIFGDKGINEKVEPDFWDSTLSKMTEHFKQGKIVVGITAGLIEAGARLKTYFPKSDNDTNELTDEISYN